MEDLVKVKINFLSRRIPVMNCDRGEEGPRADAPVKRRVRTRQEPQDAAYLLNSFRKTAH